MAERCCEEVGEGGREARSGVCEEDEGRLADEGGPPSGRLVLEAVRLPNGVAMTAAAAGPALEDEEDEGAAPPPALGARKPKREVGAANREELAPAVEVDAEAAPLLLPPPC